MVDAARARVVWDETHIQVLYTQRERERERQRAVVTGVLVEKEKK